MHITTKTIFSRVKYYLELRRKFQNLASKDPGALEKFQNEFNSSVDYVYQDILSFEKENINKPERIIKLKKIFEKRYRHYFHYGEFINWSFKKPFGYPGDFIIIDAIYQDIAFTTGFNRLWDNYFQQLAISKAIRQRKDDIKNIILEFLKGKNGIDIHIMNLACGSAREIKELKEKNPKDLFLGISFDCYDFDGKAITYAKKLLIDTNKVNFFKKNAMRMALSRDIKKYIGREYDFIYSAGLFDYLEQKIAIKLAANLKKILKKDGILLIANVRDRYSNPSVCWMEWVADWYLIYRTEDEFKKIFIEAGFPLESISIRQEGNKVMQYCLVHN